MHALSNVFHLLCMYFLDDLEAADRTPVAALMVMTTRFQGRELDGGKKAHLDGDGKHLS